MARMEDLYADNAPADYTSAFRSESCDLHTYTDVVGDQIEEYCDKEVVLDSEDEGGEPNQPVSMVNAVHFQEFSLNGAIGSGKRLRTPVGYFRRVGNKVNAYMLGQRESPRSSRCDEECPAERTCLDNGSRDQDVTIGCLASKSPDQKRIPTNMKIAYADQGYQTMLSKRMTGDSLDGKISVSPDQAMTTEKDANNGFEHEKLSYVGTPESSESMGKALDFVDHYLSTCDFGSPKDIKAKKGYGLTSPPFLSSKGSQSLARRVYHGLESRSMTFDFAEQQTDEKDELRVTDDTFDVGMDTQMAAEAMEELIYAVPPVFDACFTNQGPDNTFVENSSSGVNKNRSKQFDTRQDAFIGWRNKDKRSKRVKVSTITVKRDISNSAEEKCKSQVVPDALFPVSKNLMTKKLLNGRKINGRNCEILRNRKFGRPHRTALKQGEDRFSEIGSWQEIQKENQPIGRKRNGRSSVESYNLTKPTTSPKRRSSNIHDDVSKIKATGKCLKSNSYTSCQDISNKGKGEESLSVDAADSYLSKMNYWIYPKRKRTSHVIADRTNRSSNQSFTCAEIYLNTAGKCPPMKEENKTGRKLLVYSRRRKRVTRLLVYSRRRQFSSERKHSLTSLKLISYPSSPSMNDNEYPDRQVPIPIKLDTVKQSNKFFNSEDRQFPSSFDTPDQGKLADLSNGNPKILQVCGGSDRNKQPSSPKFRSSLTKELSRLGYTESLPDFLPKDSRRRRAAGKVCILFSQNLENNILKQQRKIVSRLGFSIALCCSDATHFVTDRFVRTRNLLEAIARGIPVVTPLWLESCEQARCVIDEKSYILRDEKREKLIGFSMPLSLSQARHYPLLKGREVFITPKVKQLKPDLDVIHCLVKAVGGQVVQNILSAETLNSAIPDDLLILSCEEDYTFCLPFLEKGAFIYSSELLLNGIVTQKLEYDRHKLFRDFS